MSNTSLEDPVVEIESGLIKGRNRRGVQTFFDIPYAAPPVGELRFAPDIIFGLFNVFLL